MQIGISVGNIMSSRPSNKGKPFDFGKNGYGYVEKESKADFETWSPTVQILHFKDPENNGDRQLRFGYCDDGGQRARPLYLDREQLEELGKAIASGDPEILDWMRAFFKGCFGKAL
jgi:hypothetical protein